MLDSATSVIAFVGLAVGAAISLGALYATLRRQARTMAAMADALLGHEEARDRSGTVFQEAQPGLAARMKGMDEKLDTIIKLELDSRVSTLEEGQANLVGRVSVLEDARVERVVTQAESAAHWRAVEAAHKDATADQSPDLD